MIAQYILSRGAAGLSALMLVMSALPGNTGAMQKMKPEELIEKHLASIGTRAALAAVRNRVVKGTATVILTPTEIRNAVFVPSKKQNPSDIKTLTGNAIFTSEGKSVQLDLHFSAPNCRGVDLENGDATRF